MNGYTIKKVNNSSFNRFLICLTFESFVNNLVDIECSQEIKDYSGKVLIDQLLVTGNGRNRFVSCNVKNGKFDLSTAHAVVAEKIFREMTIEYLFENEEYITYSILTEKQRELIKKKECF